MILFIFLWVLYCVSEAYEDSQYTLILDHRPTVYPRITIGLISLILWGQLNELSVYGYATFAFILATVFWFVFELSGNLFRAHYFYYIGTTSRIDGKLKTYEWPVFWLRIFLVALAFCLYYYDELLSTANDLG